jgi:DNA-directed RNA polymerase sigma subunit (sigma70/sigma32)
LVMEIERFRVQFIDQYGRPPADVDVANELGVSSDTVKQLQIVSDQSSLDVVSGADGLVSVHELVPDEKNLNPEELCLCQEERGLLLKRRQLVLDILSEIPEREWDQRFHSRNVRMFIEHYGLDGSGRYPTQQELAEAHGITRQAVSLVLIRLYEKVQMRIGRAEGKRVPAGSRSRTVWRGSAGTGLLG